VSLPERLFRSGAALAGGLIRQLGDVTLPAAVRRTKTYQTMVDIALRFMIEQVGQVEGVYPSAGELAEGDLANNFLMRRTAGHGIELVGILAFRASPVWIMAALADISGAGRQIVQEVADALKQEGKHRSTPGRPGTDRGPSCPGIQCAAARRGRTASGVGRISLERRENSSAKPAVA
jgi:hypothetical protein